jgi:hypothetical protein
LANQVYPLNGVDLLIKSGFLIERMAIRSFASLPKNKKKIQTNSISEYVLANGKIDK